MYDNLAQTAINSALKCDWSEAIKINKILLSQDKNDIEALNRLARAYYESGNIKLAQKTSLNVLKIEPSNKIAEKAVEKYKRSLPLRDKRSLPLRGKKANSIVASDFIEEIGTTKLTQLLNLCSENIISSLDSGDEVFLSTHSHRVTVITHDKRYIGKLPDDLSARLRLLTKEGYEYRVIIMSANKENIKIIIKETKKGKGYEKINSFPVEVLEPIGEFAS
jgi:tetratricopeptide (TPR) repeat protein